MIGSEARKAIACGVVFVWGGQKTWAREPVRILADPWCPYTCSFQTEGVEGILVETLRLLLDPKKWDLQYETVNWSRARLEVKEGRADVLLGTDPDESKELRYPRSGFLNTEYCYYTEKNSNWRFDGKASFHSVRLGLIKDYTYGEELESYIGLKNRGVVEYISGDFSLKRLFLMLEKKRIDVLSDDRRVVQWMLNKEKNRLPVRQAGCDKAHALWAGFSPAHVRLPVVEALIQEINNASKNLADNPSFLKILERYEQLSGGRSAP